MKLTNEEVIKFLETNKVGVLAVVSKEGNPHGATLHFSQTTDPFRLYFLTDKKSEKCSIMIDGSTVKASFVVGSNEANMVTTQIDGECRIVGSINEASEIKEIHFGKIESARKFENNPDSVFIEFTPKKWKYTDYTKRPPFQLKDMK